MTLSATRPPAAGLGTPLDAAVAAVMAIGTELPAAVRTRSVSTWRDGLAVLAGGARTDAATIAAAYARGFPGAAPLIGGGSAAAPWAAFANATALAALDFEDGHAEGGAMHPASPILPAVLAAAGHRTTIAQARQAQVSGYELALRVGRALLEHDRSVWFHATGTPGAVGAAIAVCQLRGADAEVARRAAHIAWLHAPFSTGGWPMIKESIGWGAMTGLVAADLARAGMNALPEGYRPPEVNIQPETPLSLAGASDDRFLGGIGRTFHSLDTYFKPFAACRWTHSAAAALQELRAVHGLTPGRIARIDVFTHEGATHLSEPAPRTIEHGQYSFEMVLSAIARHGQAGAEEMSVAAMAVPERLALAARVHLHHDPALDHYVPAKLPARVRVTLVDGSTCEELAIDSPGENDRPLSAGQLNRKWHVLLDQRMGVTAADTLLAALADDDAPLLEVVAPLFAATATESAT